MYDGNKLKVTFRQVTTENINPNDRKLGYNWDTKTYLYTQNLNLIPLKAISTIKEIEDSGSQIEQETPILKVDMTYDMAKYIKSKTSSSYSDDTLVCYDYEENGKTKYKNIFCYSTLLDDLEEKYSNNITFINTRAKSIDTISGKRTNKLVTDSGYWTIYTKENVPSEYNSLLILNTFNYSIASHIGGPSWK